MMNYHCLDSRGHIHYTSSPLLYQLASFGGAGKRSKGVNAPIKIVVFSDALFHKHNVLVLFVANRAKTISGELVYDHISSKHQ